MKPTAPNIAIVCLMPLLLLATCTSNGDEKNENTTAGLNYDLRSDLQPERLTIAMWDFSWLYMHYEGGAFEDFGTALDELKERGFNTVRIDAFPMITGQLESEQEAFTLKGDPLRPWGASDKDREHQVAGELLEFMSLAKQKDIYVILSTWNTERLDYPELLEAYSGFNDYWQAWERTLGILDENQLLDHVLYVDLDQEFPYFSPFQERIDQLWVSRNITGNAMDQAGAVQPGFSWNNGQLAYVKDYLESSLKHFQHLYPGLRFTFSLTSYWKEIRSLDIRNFDVLELHIWLTSSARFEDRTGFGRLEKDRGDHDYSGYMHRINAAMHSVRPMLLKDMHNQLRFAREWSEEIATPLTTTEAWGPWFHMDHPDLEWQWLYDWCEQCMGLSSQYGFWGTTPWNYSHPYWANWENIEWYQKVNSRFLNN